MLRVDVMMEMLRAKQIHFVIFIGEELAVDNSFFE